MLQCIFVVVIAASKSLALQVYFSQNEPRMREGFLRSAILIAFMIASSSGPTIRYSHPPTVSRPFWSSLHGLKPVTGSKKFDGYLDAINWTFKLPLQRVSWENRVSSLAAVWETSMSRTKSLYSSGTREDAIAQALGVTHLCT